MSIEATGEGRVTESQDRSATEIEAKHHRLIALLDARGLDAVLLRRASSFAWASGGGRGYVNGATDYGEASLLFTRDERHVLTNNIEAARLEKEEGLGTDEWTFQVHSWLERSKFLDRFAPGRLGADAPERGAVDLSQDIARLRSALLPVEVTRMRELARSAAAGLEQALLGARPGESENAIAARVAASLLERGILPIVLQVACDGRAAAFKHALPTGATLERYALVGVCGRRKGLVCSVSRAIHFGALPEALTRSQRAVAGVEAAMLLASRPGATLRHVFAQAQKGYAKTNSGEEWRLHHQGGIAGYEPREYLARPDSEVILQRGHVVAYNPTLGGAKSEDTALVNDGGCEILSTTPTWPTIDVEHEGVTFARPWILELD